MNSPICSQLDYVWFALVLSLSIGSASIGAGLVVSWLLRYSNPVLLKWFWRLLWSQILVFVSFGLASLFLKQAPDCFEAAFSLAPGGAPLTRILALVWLSGVTALTSLDCVRAVLEIRRRRHWRVLNLLAVERVQARMGLRRRVQVFSTEEQISPFVFGWFKPKLVLPRKLLLHLEPAQMEAVIAHELAHIMGFDTIWSLPELMVRRLLFFHPASLFATHAYYDIQERAADFSAMKALRLSARQYSESFLALVGWVAQQRNATHPAAVSTYQKLKERLEFIGRSHLTGNRSQVFAARGLIGLSLVLSGSWCIGQTRAISLPSAEGAEMCVQIEHERFLEQFLHLQSEPKTCEQEKK